MKTQRKLASYPLFFEHVPYEVPQPKQRIRRRPGRKPKYPRLPETNILDNVE